MTEQIFIWTYQERYTELEESQKMVSHHLELWHKRNQLKNTLIEALHIKSERRITGVFEGHRDELMEMELDGGLLLRLMLFLSQSLSFDGEKRVCFLFFLFLNFLNFFEK